MAKRRWKAVNIKIRFGTEVVTLQTEDDKATTPNGIEIWVDKKPANVIKPFAAIPDGTLSRYMHTRPVTEHIEWVEA